MAEPVTRSETGQDRTQVPILEKGFLGRLFDPSFSEFVTTKIVSVLYVLAIIFGGLMSLFIGLMSFMGAGMLAAATGSRSEVAIFMVAAGTSLLFVPVVFFVFVLIARISLEAMVVVFRIADNTTRLARQSTATPGI